MFSITQIEAAINYWRDQDAMRPDADSLTLGDNTRALASVYGQLIYDGVESIAEDQLTEKQRQALQDCKLA